MTRYGGQPTVYDPNNPFGVLYDGMGTIFKIQTDGTGFRLLRAFGAHGNEARYPSGALTSDGLGNLYGATEFGSSANDAAGTVFRIRTDGSGFQILHSFAGGATDGRNPVASLVLDRSGNLYGMTREDAATGDQATIFKVTTDATDYQTLRIFSDTSDGSTPSGSLILAGSDTLYGTMAYGGVSAAGTVFRINTDGSRFDVLYAFAGFMNDGSLPLASSPGIVQGSSTARPPSAAADRSPSGVRAPR